MNAFDLEQQGFLDSLFNTNRIIYLRRKISNLLRSWIIFQSFCLNIDIIRHYEPFNGCAFRFRYPYNVRGMV